MKRSHAKLLLANLKRNAPDPKRRQHPVVQELQDAVPGKAHHRPKKAEGDAADHPRFAVHIDLRFCDNRRRDCDGAVSTVLDCLVRSLNDL